MRRIRSLFALAALALSALVPAFTPSIAEAQLRTIPSEAKRGQLRHLQEMMVELDGDAVLLAAGAQIRGPDNRIVLPSSLVDRVVVKYTRNTLGQLHRVWVLTPDEVARPDPEK